MKIVVCDTGPILHLREADCLSILQAAGSIHIPPAVDAEMARLDRLWAAPGAGMGLLEVLRPDLLHPLDGLPRPEGGGAKDHAA